MSTARPKALLVMPTFSIAGEIGKRLNDPSYTFDILHVPSLPAALKRCESEAFDVVFLSLSELDNSFRGLSEIQNLLPDAPLLIVASKTDQVEALRAIQKGADDCILIDVPSQGIRQTAINAIERKRFLKEIRSSGCEDSVTNVYNLDGFESAAQRLFRSCRKSLSKVYLLLFRVQGAPGSRLTNIAEALRNACTKGHAASACVSRVSPEEFAILTPADSLAEARGLFSHAEETLGTLMDKEHEAAWSVVFGLAAYDPEYPSSPESVLERARQDVKPDCPIQSALSIA
jgi:PleD family two-component response regulator